MLIYLVSSNDPAWKDEGHPLLVSLCHCRPGHSCMGAGRNVRLEGLPRVVLLTFLSALTGGAARRTQTHPPLPLYGVAGPRSPRDHAVPDPVCEDCQGLHQQDAWGRAHRGALQVLGHSEPINTTGVLQKGRKAGNLLGGGFVWAQRMLLCSLLPSLQPHFFSLMSPFRFSSHRSSLSPSLLELLSFSCWTMCEVLL